MIYYKLLAFLSVLMTAYSQVSLKIGAEKKINKSVIKSFFNFWTITGYIILASVTLINLFVYKVLPFNLMIIFLPMNYFFVVAFSIIILKEKINKNRVVGLFVIILGIIIYNNL